MALGFEEKLVSNLTDFKVLGDYVFDEDYTFDEFHDNLQKRVETCKRIIDENRVILENALKPLLQNIGSLPVSEADSLFGLSTQLYTFNNPLDIGLSLEILEHLVKWARNQGCTDRLIKFLYHAGFIYQQTSYRLSNFEIFIFNKEGKAAFQEAASYTRNYFDISSKETRSYINRCLGNVYVMSRRNRSLDANFKEDIKIFLNNVEPALEFWNREDVRAFDPDMPWEKYIENAHQNTSSWIWTLSREKYRLDDMFLCRKVYSSCAYLLQFEGSGEQKDFFNSYQIGYMENAAEYCIGNISYQEMVDNIRAMYLNADDFDYSTSGMYANLSTPIDLIRLIKPEDKLGVSFKTEVKLIIERMHGYCKNFPQEGNKVLFLNYVAQVCKIMVEYLNFEDSVELILGMTVYTHLPTYVHSLMVQDISAILTDYVLSKRPEYFVGIAQTTSALAVIRNQAEVKKLLGLAALCHDVGKILYLDRVAIFSRKLYDFEFEIIKRHTNTEGFIKTDNDKLKLVAAVAEGHHMWCNASGGYGRLNAKYKSAINIVTIADSIDAATDGIGRYYSKVLALEDVLREIQEQAGSRYCPVVAEMLKDGELVERIRESITTGRKNAYYKAYLHMRGREDIV